MASNASVATSGKMCIRDRFIHDDPPDLSLADLAQQLLKLRPVRIFTGIAFVLEYPAAPTFQFILAKVNLTFNADTVLAVY